MSRSGQLVVSRTRDIVRPNEYILALQGEFSQWSFDEEAAPGCRGRWLEILNLGPDAPIDVELGTGNGLHFAYYGARHRDRGLVGFELKYKPLIQSIRRAVRAGCTNTRIVRFNAALIHQVFAPSEVSNVFIHFPDPWEKLRNHKHRLIQDDFLKRLFEVQRPGSFLDFKTDSLEYFEWARERFHRSPYRVVAESFSLHQSDYAATNFVTHFESLFLRQNLPIHFARLERV